MVLTFENLAVVTLRYMCLSAFTAKFIYLCIKLFSNIHLQITYKFSPLNCVLSNSSALFCTLSSSSPLFCALSPSTAVVCALLPSILLFLCIETRLCFKMCIVTSCALSCALPPSSALVCASPPSRAFNRTLPSAILERRHHLMLLLMH